jgi:Uma2 family endonuclease
MSTATLISEQEYLASSYDPDQDYVEGVLLERNVGEFDHSNLQSALLVAFRTRQHELGIRVVVEQRVQVRSGRYRVPDLCILDRSLPKEQVVHHPPLLVVEVLSPRDAMSEMQERIDDYLALGVHEVWVVDPRRLRAWIYQGPGRAEAVNGELQWRGLTIRLAELADA